MYTAAASIAASEYIVLELLEIMESGLQYERTRGNMKESVIEKVEKLFEEDSEE